MNVQRARTKATGKRPIRLRFLKLIDVVLISAPEQILWLNQQADVRRPIDPHASWLHRWLDRRLHRDLAFHGQRLAVFVAREDAPRAEQQRKLHEQFAAKSRDTAVEREMIARWVAGARRVDEIGRVVQQWCGKLFFPNYRATRETYEAGKLLAAWPSAPPWRTSRARGSGRLTRAKQSIEHAAQGDLYCVHGTSIGMENVARSVRCLRKAASSRARHRLSADEALRECLAVPAAVLRGCSRPLDVPFLAEPLTERSLLVFMLGRAFRKSGELDVAFLSDTWSRCPARHVIPDMLRAVWPAEQPAEHAAHEVAERPDGSSRPFPRPVS
jgi:hypothetical protein